MKSRMDELYELKETLSVTLGDLDRGIELQSNMVEMLRNEEDQELIKDYLEGFENNLQEAQNNKIILEHRQGVLLELLEDYETNKWMSAIINNIVTRAFEAVGMAYLSDEGDGLTP